MIEMMLLRSKIIPGKLWRMLKVEDQKEVEAGIAFDHVTVN